MSTSDWILIALQELVVIGFIALGVRSGGIGLGLWAGVGTLVLVFGFVRARRAAHERDADHHRGDLRVPAMQAAGGIDYMVLIAAERSRRAQAARLRRRTSPGC